jgi:hypothetical protein
MEHIIHRHFSLCDMPGMKGDGKGGIAGICSCCVLVWGMDDRDPSLLPGTRVRARGVGSNMAGRFEGKTVEAAFDGWDMTEEARLLRTQVRTERPRSAITWQKSPDLPFDRSINPYRGCEHGCVYCFARPSHAYLNLSPGLDFETRLVARPGIAEVLAQELRKPGYVVAPMALGTNTDPYQPIEAEIGADAAGAACVGGFWASGVCDDAGGVGGAGH